MSDYDRLVLRHLAGEDVPGLVWGATMGETVEWLKGRGYVRLERNDDRLRYVITEAGRKALQL